VGSNFFRIMLSLRFVAPVAFAALALCGSMARAATFNVNGEPQALISAINAANSNGGDDVINITSDIELNSVNNSSFGPTGLPVITVDGTLTINGNGHRIKRPNDINDAVFRLLALGQNAVVIVNDLNLSFGTAVQNNSFESSRLPANRGGAIYNDSAQLTLNNCEFRDNTGVSGGAIFNGKGAALRVKGGIFRFNRAGTYGGAIYNEAGDVALENVRFLNNSVEGYGDFTGGYGGAVCSRGFTADSQRIGSSPLQIRNCTFGDANQGNTALSGGAIMADQGSPTSIANSSFRFNRAWIGGAIENFAALTIASSTFADNEAQFEGGGIYTQLSYAANGRSVQILNSTFSDNSAQNGGALSNFGGLVALESCTLTRNQTTVGGTAGLASATDASTRTRVSNSIIAGNRGDDVNYDIPDMPPSGGNVDTIESGGYNLIGIGNAVRNFNATGDQTGIGNPKLDALSNNGGPTLTAVLQRESPALNAGNPALQKTSTTGDPQFDQRGEGFSRVRGARADIGAFELQADLPSVVVSLAPGAPKTNDVLTATAVVTSETGSPTVSYQWLRNGTPIPDETDSTLQLAKSGNGDKGDVIAVVVRATDSEGTSAPAGAQVTVVNSAPIAVSSQGSVDVDTEKGFPLLGFDADGDALTFERVGGPRNGVKADIRVDTDGVTKLFYRSRPKYGGVDVIRFVARDSDGKLSNESTLGISVNYTPPPAVNRAPVAGDTNIDTFVGKSEVKGLLGRDPDGDAITFRLVNNAKYGKSEIRQDSDGLYKLFYTSLNRFYANDRVTYIVIDSHGKQSNLATVNINFINRAPVAQGNKLTVASGEPISQFLFGTDEDGDALSFRLVNNPQYGRGEIKRDEVGAWRVYYQSVAGYIGPDRITLIAIDPMGRESQVATAEINVVRVTGTPSAPDAIRPSEAPSGGGS